MFATISIIVKRPRRKQVVPLSPEAWVALRAELRLVSFPQPLVQNYRFAGALWAPHDHRLELARALRGDA